jgi:hypothetical protein
MQNEPWPGQDPNNPDDLLPFDTDANDLPPPVVLGEEAFLFIGEGLTAGEFADYVRDYDFGTIPPDYVVLHHTAIPSTRQARYPTGGVWDDNETGLSEAQIKARRQAMLHGIKNVYACRPGWDRGPHLFIDDRYIWLFSPMREVGIHAAQGNSYHDAGGLHYSIGIEVVGYYEKVHWPEPIERMVGHAVAVLKRHLGTFDLHYQPRAGAISSHRDYNKPTCPGAAISNQYYIQVLQGGWSALGQAVPASPRLAPAPAPAPTSAPAPAPASAPAAATTITENTPIFGPPSATPAQAAAYMASRPHGEYTDHDIANVIVPAYFAVCTRVGIDPVLAIAQMIHETDNLNSFWAARPQRNPAGIGVNGQRQAERPANTTNWAFNTQRQVWETGLSFKTWQDDSIVAHVGRLAAYALAAGGDSPEQHELIGRALAYRPLPANMRGSAPTLKQLGKAHNPTGQGWASPGTDYGAKLAAIAQRIVDLKV